MDKKGTDEKGSIKVCSLLLDKEQKMAGKEAVLIETRLELEMYNEINISTGQITG